VGFNSASGSSPPSLCSNHFNTLLLAKFDHGDTFSNQMTDSAISNRARDAARAKDAMGLAGGARPARGVYRGSQAALLGPC
jgi:hypothetical protein